ncbi:twitching motility protein PilT [Methanococcoides sp. SA1]|nr:twitching motility protein PilT [Methanococcoides sp. SA1]
MTTHKPIKHSAQFRFYNELNDFLPQKFKDVEFIYQFINKPSIKDTIQAIGIPHVEVDLIIVNRKSIDFEYLMFGGEEIQIYPKNTKLKGIHLQPIYPTSKKFIIDVNLGKLVPKLRLLGFDTLYQNDYEDHEIVEVSNQENRIILTRDIGILKYNAVKFGYWVRNTKPHLQVEEVIRKFSLKQQIKAFTRCSSCNGNLMSVPKESINHLLAQKIQEQFRDFTQCESCQKVYWQGSHVDKILKWIANL